MHQVLDAELVLHPGFEDAQALLARVASPARDRDRRRRRRCGRASEIEGGNGVEVGGSGGGGGGRKGEGRVGTGGDGLGGNTTVGVLSRVRPGSARRREGGRR